MVTPHAAVAGPTCVKRGANTKIELIDTTGNALSWQVINLKLEGTPQIIDPSESYQLYWSGQSSSLLTPSQQFDIPAFPDHVEYCKVSGDVVIAFRMGGGGDSSEGNSSRVKWRRFRISNEGLIEVPFDGGEGDTDINADLFLVQRAPTAPMSPAWATLLQYPCSWASKDTVDIDIAKEITFGVFWYGPGFAYDSGTATRWLQSTTFYLKSLLEAFTSPVEGNCVDTSAMDVVCKNAVGLEYRMRQLTSEDDASLTNPICLVGSDASQSQNYHELPWNNISWAWHSLAVPNGWSFSNSTPIYTACEAHLVDLSNANYKNPPAHHTNHAFTQRDYWQKPISSVRVGLWQEADDLYAGNNPIRYTSLGGSNDWYPTSSCTAWSPP